MNIFSTIKIKLRAKFGKDIGVLIPDAEHMKEEVKYVKPATWHFRCPCCGNAHDMLLTSSIKLTQDETLKKLSIVVAKAGCNDEDVKGGPMFKAILDTRADEFPPNKDILCLYCREHSPRWKWHDAYRNAYRYLDMDGDQLCHCGGELYMEKIPGTQKFGMVCDRCNWVKPNAVVNGGANDEGREN